MRATKKKTTSCDINIIFENISATIVLVLA